ncbi:hypothetical protein ANCDUO_25919 [Ancylostoma duodenale]|uniref:Uncharacterized protein n=1 Tax=Ancylostoma duodenale TaxID=51022 RepID=A0A0C2C367_9BILA|nr:hypothetical protein ANCDUO_25919 [Ancylostoma duodenale]
MEVKSSHGHDRMNIGRHPFSCFPDGAKLSMYGEQISDCYVNAFTESPTGETVASGDIPRENATEYKWIRIEYADEAHPALLLSTPEAIEGLALKISLDALQRFEKVGLYLPGICADYVPKAIDEFDKSSFKGVEIEGPIGVNITALEAAGVNLTALAEKLRNDTEVDEILSRTNASTK